MSPQDLVLVRDYLADKGVVVDHMTDDEVISYWYDWNNQAA